MAKKKAVTKSNKAPKFKRPLTKKEEEALIAQKEKSQRQINTKARHDFIDMLYKKYE